MTDRVGAGWSGSIGLRGDRGAAKGVSGVQPGCDPVPAVVGGGADREGAHRARGRGAAPGLRATPGESVAPGSYGADEASPCQVASWLQRQRVLRAHTQRSQE